MTNDELPEWFKNRIKAMQTEYWNWNFQDFSESYASSEHMFNRMKIEIDQILFRILKMTMSDDNPCPEEPEPMPESIPEWLSKKIDAKIKRLDSKHNKITHIGPSLERDLISAEQQALRWVLSLKNQETQP